MATLIGTPPTESIQHASMLGEFAADVHAGLSSSMGKTLPSRFLYDDLGSSLFEAITLLSEYGLTRADERILKDRAPEIASICGPLLAVAELGSGTGKKTTHILRAALQESPTLSYYPIDVSSAALACCAQAVSDFCRVCPIQADWTQGLKQIAARRASRLPVLLLFVGSSIGNLDRSAIPVFLRDLRSQLREGDFLLLGADLEKDIDTMITAYDDPTGVTAAFNLNLLGRINRELGGHFDLRTFRHEARWSTEFRRIEMHLISQCNQHVAVDAMKESYKFVQGESIWTESSHKFLKSELLELAQVGGFESVEAWTDELWPLAEVLWRAV